MQIKLLLVHKIVGIMLAYLNCHAYRWWFSFLLANSCLVVICLFVCSWWLVFVDNYCYYCLSITSNSKVATKVERAGSLALGQCTGRNSGITHACMSCIQSVRKLYLQFCVWVYLSPLLLLVDS